MSASMPKVADLSRGPQERVLSDILRGNSLRIYNPSLTLRSPLFSRTGLFQAMKTRSILKEVL